MNQSSNSQSPCLVVASERMQLGTGYSRMMSCIALFLIPALLPGCGYPEVSPFAYDASKALYAACNLKRADALDRIETEIESARQDERLTDDEVRWLSDILAQARDGDWEQAGAEARAILEDQIEE